MIPHLRPRIYMFHLARVHDIEATGSRRTPANQENPGVGDTSGRAATVRSCEEMPEFENTIAWGDTKSLDGPSERVVGLLMRPPAVENSRFSAVLIISQLLTVAAPMGDVPGHAIRA